MRVTEFGFSLGARAGHRCYSRARKVTRSNNAQADSGCAQSRHAMKLAVEVDQTVAVGAHANLRGLDEHHRVRAHFLQIDDPSLQARERVAQYGHAMRAFVPDGQAEARFHRQLREPGEVSRE